MPSSRNCARMALIGAASNFRALCASLWNRVALVLTAALLAVVWVLPALAVERGTVFEARRMPSRILGKDVAYTVYLPPKYEQSNRRYPVVYLLHGGWGGGNEDWFRHGGVDHILDRMIASGELPPLIAVTPEGRRDEADEFYTYYMNDADGGYRWKDMFHQEFIQHVERTYRVIAGRSARNAIGLSMGGYAALAYAFKDPELFASVAVLSGAIRTDWQVAYLDQAGYDRRFGKAWGMGLEGKERLNEHYRANSVFELLKSFVPAAEKPTQFYFDCGADDVFFAGNAALHIKMRQRGIEHRFQIREGRHEWPYWRKTVPDALRFVADSFRR
ncbi:alpha/beta hydrolase [Jiella mangrovi]|uniref:Esterase family protein n=1 Tax=Jiella mangrovi TaxID=2821407 RepID=A0ABS4BCF8_9HYPH|nr:alpha/beta hydrolase-fold protein [Jiella mangrovi]MBP0614440.1 esterase family protein [Jiella mangrovi]